MTGRDYTVQIETGNDVVDDVSVNSPPSAPPAHFTDGGRMRPTPSISRGRRRRKR